MGNNCCQGPPSEFVVFVRTGDRTNAGTDANVSIVLHDDYGNRSDPIDLDNILVNDFERGQLDVFVVPMSRVQSMERLARVDAIELWCDASGLGSDWYVDKVMVENKQTNAIFIFPVFRWLVPGRHYFITHLDTSLPQSDVFLEQRWLELKEKQEAYRFTQVAPGMPAQIKKLPQEERFTDEYRWNMKKMKYEMVAVSKIVMFTTGRWKSLADLKNIYTKKVFVIPKEPDGWRSDLYFSRQRICSLNHSVIELVTNLPSNLPVTDAMLEPFLNGLTIQQAIDQKRLFMCDLKVLEGVPVREDLTMCVPLALFFVDDDQQLRPVAIQLFQQPAADNPIFLPSDPHLTWCLAKMWYNLADASHHQALTHLGFTHLLMEGVAISTHRHLSQSHPIFKLLAHHFFYLIAINKLAVNRLLIPNGIVDNIMSVGARGLMEIIKRGYETWRMDIQGTLPEELKSRGLDDPKVLPGYHFRDDAMLYYVTIKKYVTAYVNLYYDPVDRLTGDSEIQAWAAELVKPRDKEHGGCGLLGVPGDGQLTSVDQLVAILTSIIYTCSVSHASTNFPQYDEYGFPPNYPGLLRGQPPRDKVPRTEEDIIKTLPDRPTTLSTMLVTKILSSKGTSNIGNFEVQYIFEEKAKEVLERFRKDLKDMTLTIKSRNAVRKVPYEYLDPSIVPNSISI